ncbi:MAG: NADH-quinone oxidoreductase subunit J [Pseudomonadota bacterium]|nr:NADH-quinone oxidoreductase subunit J [Pseudomonadota bacterium]
MNNFFVSHISPQYLSFYLISLIVILPALVSVMTSNIKIALVSLFFTFFGISGYYVLLYSEFLAITQVVVYVGAILILLIFAFLLLDLKFLKGESKIKQKISSFFVALMFFIFIPFCMILKSTWSGENKVINKPNDIVESMGALLLIDEFILLEVAGALLLLALIGASLMIKREK